MNEPFWGALKFNGQIFAIYRLPGTSQSRYLRRGGKRLVFATEAEARAAAKKRCHELLYPPIVSTNKPPDEQKLAEKLGVENWLKVKREDAKKARQIVRKGKRTVVVNGRAR